MTHFEERLRATLLDMADEVEDVPLLQRLDQHPAHSVRRRDALVAVAAVSLAVALVAVGSWLVHQRERGSIIEPVVRPPKTVRLSESATTAPGRGLIALVLADSTAKNSVHEKPAYVLTRGRAEAVRIPDSETEPTWPEHLSVDGTRLIREVDSTQGKAPDWNRNSTFAVPTLEIVDLRTGATERLPGVQGTCPALSPDNADVAAYGPGGVELIDVATASVRDIGRPPAADPSCGGLAWTPDSRRLVIVTATGSEVVDRRGRILFRLPHRHAVNGSMSWSPDGRYLLLYDTRAGHYVLHDAATGSMTTLARPAGGVRALGWSGTHVVWLAGTVGRQRLVLTDRDGGTPRVWTRLDTGGMPIETVSWSADLRGTARAR